VAWTRSCHGGRRLQWAFQILVCGCCSEGCVLDPCGLFWQLAGSSSPLFPTGGVGAASLDRIMVAVLGFLSRQDEDLSDACLH
jgi:hypothetical protein